MQVFSTRTYERAIRKLLGEEACREMEDSVLAVPSSGAPAVSESCDGPGQGAESREESAQSVFITQVRTQFTTCPPMRRRAARI